MLYREGVAATCRRAWSQFAGSLNADRFDRANGTETSGLVPLWQLSIDSANARYGERYEATTEDELVEALAFLDEPLYTFSFVDLGCGKGRTLIVAARLNFKEVVGVEFARELADIAKDNLVRQGASRATVMHADAASYAFPAGNTVVYLYNPFSEQVLAQVLENMRASGEGKRYVIYKAPRCARMLDECGFLERHGQPPGAAHIQVWRGGTAAREDAKATA